MKEDVDGLDLIDLAKIIHAKTDRFAGMLLADLEIEFENGKQPDFTVVRKMVLDYFNGCRRSILRVLVGGDVEPDRNG